MRTPTNKQIEAGARALYRAAGWDVDWKNIAESGRDRFRDVARVTIAAAIKVAAKSKPKRAARRAA